MSALCWNYRGLGLPLAVDELRRLIHQHNPCIVFLCESKLPAEQIHRIQAQLGFSHAFAIDAIGSRGGLAFFWKESMDMQILLHSTGHVDMFCTVNDF